jgi:CHASE2 domain-containing sensor protein
MPNTAPEVAAAAHDTALTDAGGTSSLTTKVTDAAGQVVETTVSHDERLWMFRLFPFVAGASVLTGIVCLFITRGRRGWIPLLAGIGLAFLASAVIQALDKQWVSWVVAGLFAACGIGLAIWHLRFSYTLKGGLGKSWKPSSNSQRTRPGSGGVPSGSGLGTS